MRIKGIEIPPYPTDEDHAPLLVDLGLADVVRAGEVAEGDLILATVDERGVDYFNDQYTAHPKPHDPTCECGNCCHSIDEDRPIANLGDDNPWDVCDWHLADCLLLIVRAARLT
ncbi:hypothetical protein [Streptomyces lasiicapitis]|uniref:hypothetical protein n=1 Tax=Streptomyces lasiicapitis TaxID=1923961 RepID=UPI00369FB58B